MLRDIGWKCKSHNNDRRNTFRESSSTSQLRWKSASRSFTRKMMSVKFKANLTVNRGGRRLTVVGKKKKRKKKERKTERKKKKNRRRMRMKLSRTTITPLLTMKVTTT